MTNMITVDIYTPKEIHERSQIPDEYSIQEVIDELIDNWELSRFDAARAPIEYSLYSMSAKAYLSPADNVAAALHNGDAIRLEARVNGQEIEVSPGPSGAIPTTRDENSGEISVFLTVLDLNRTEQVKFSTTRSVGDLIKQIVSNYNLPARSKQMNLIKYRLKSKSVQGDKEGYLLESMTLAQAGVPASDRLTLHRQEEAAGRRA